MAKAFYYPINEEPFTSDEKPTLKEAQEFVGGYVEKFPKRFLPKGFKGELLMNEDGRLKNMPLNEVVSKQVGFEVVGPAIVLQGCKF